MNARTLKIVVISGSLAILCIVVVQLKFMWRSFNQEQQEFNQSVQLALLDVVRQYYSHPDQAPIENPVKQQSDDYFVVDINQDINAEVLEIYLVEFFAKYRIRSDFEYAIYNCENDQMVYGNYMSGGDVIPAKKSPVTFAKSPNLTYYFGIHFPDIKWQMARSLSLWIILVVVSIVVVAFFGYAIFVIWRQKQLSELQRDFINNMTHEFKTPLSSLTLAANYLSRRPGLDKRAQNYASIIRQLADNLNSKVEQILQVASIEKSRHTNDKVEVDLPALLNSIVEFERSRHLQVTIVYETLVPEAFKKLNPAHFETIILNLLDNAIKYGGNQSEVKVQLSQEVEFFCIAIADRGPGIPQQHLKDIFKKFYRVPGVGDRQKGFGLGLYHVRQICKINRWSIHAESKFNNSTTFILKIPVKR